ncbi:MAG: sigma factor-like helix-turn-helix DNA-binding protein [Solirubrobacteraceae bacterium]
MRSTKRPDASSPHRRALAHRRRPPRARVARRRGVRGRLAQAEIGQHIGVSQMQVSRLLRRALARLRVLAGAPEDP